MMRIESRSNPLIKQTKSLESIKGRKELQLHMIEGRKLLNEAVISCMELVDGFIEDEHCIEAEVLKGCGANVYCVSRQVMEALCNTKTPQNICATVKTPQYIDLAGFSSGMFIALDAVQDPGNLGAIIRTADAMGANGILIGEGSADPYAPKTLRASMGSAYHLPLWKGNLNEALRVLRDKGFICISGHLQGEEVLPQTTDRCVIVIGNEGNGVKEENDALCTRVRIPMYGKAESLNASVAASLLMYEVAKKLHTKT